MGHRGKGRGEKERRGKEWGGEGIVAMDPTKVWEEIYATASDH